jgi:hypothetical protein
VDAGAPPSPCAALPPDAPGAAIFDALFRAHAEGRIDAELIDAPAADVSPVPLATELVCPSAVREIATEADGSRRLALSLTAGADVVESEVVLTAHGRLAAASLARMRVDLQALLVRRMLRAHPEIELFAVTDVPEESPFPDRDGASPRRRARAQENLRLAFARVADGSVLCVLRARADATSTRSWCWRDDMRLERVIASPPMIVDENVQMTFARVPVRPPGRVRAAGRTAEVTEIRLPALEARRLGSMPRPPDAVGTPSWDPVPEPVPRVASMSVPDWSPLAAVDAAPPWLALSAAVPWLRVAPVASTAEGPAIALTVDAEETRRWLAVRAPSGWLFGDALDRPAPDGMTSWDRVEPAAALLGDAATLLAWSSDHGDGRGAAHLRVLRPDGERLVERAALVVGRARAFWNDEAPEDPVTARIVRPGPADAAAPAGPRHRVVWRARLELSAAGAPGCVRARRALADVAHTTRDFRPLADRPRAPFDPAALPASIALGELAATTGVHVLADSGFANAARCPVSSP